MNDKFSDQCWDLITFFVMDVKNFWNIYRIEFLIHSIGVNYLIWVLIEKSKRSTYLSNLATN